MQKKLASLSREPKMVKKMYESALSALETYMADRGYDEEEYEE